MSIFGIYAFITASLRYRRSKSASPTEFFGCQIQYPTQSLVGHDNPVHSIALPAKMLPWVAQAVGSALHILASSTFLLYDFFSTSFLTVKRISFQHGPLCIFLHYTQTVEARSASHPHFVSFHDELSRLVPYTLIRLFALSLATRSFDRPDSKVLVVAT